MRKFILFFSSLFVFFCLLAFLPSQAKAVTEDQKALFRAQLNGKVPVAIADNIAAKCLDSGWSIYAAQWLSAQGAPAATSVVVDYGTTSVVLDLNYITYRCKAQSKNIASSENFEISNAPNTNLGTYASVTPYPANNANTYNTGFLRKVTYSNGSPLVNGIYTINYKDRGTRTQSNGTFCAIHNAGDYAGVPNPAPFGGCTYGDSQFDIYVNVLPKPTYSGSIQTNKRLLSNSQVASSSEINPADSKIELISPSATKPVFDSNTTLNSWTRPNVYVKWNDIYSNDVGTGWYSDRITVPAGWRINRVQTSLPNNTSLSNSGLSCTGANNTGVCTVGGLKVYDDKVTYVDWFFENIEPIGNLDDICNYTFKNQPDDFFTSRNTSREQNEKSAWGWVYDPGLLQSTNDNTKTPSNARIVFDEGTPNQQTKVVLADDERTNLTSLYGIKSPFHSFLAEVPIVYFDGNQHTAKLYIEYGTGPSLKPIGDPKTFTCEKYYYPWLQTKQGDVVADGKIIGQNISTNNLLAGARPDERADKEAEFLVISAAGGSGPFCSTYKYILTNTNALRGNCDNGAGYTFNGEGINSSTVDRVLGGVNQAYNDNLNSSQSANGCSTNNIATVNLPNPPASISTNCRGGVIYKLDQGNITISGLNVLQGRATIYIEGDLEIAGDITYSGSAYPDPVLVPNLAIVVSGNITIKSTVGKIEAQLYSAKKINTCSDDTNLCSAIQLNVNGTMSAKEGFAFNRTFINEAQRLPAEIIKLTSQSISFPPPGIESRYFSDDFEGYKLDSSEYDPRF